MRASEAENRGSLVVATNREPYRLTRSRGGETRLEQTAGGLVSALAPAVVANGGAWFAWNPDSQIDESAFAGRLGHDLTLVPVSGEEIKGYYLGFANGALWPLCHYALDRCRFRDEDWRRYVDVNRRFADRLAERAARDRLVWVHDYHLMLVPGFIREIREPRARLAYFHHIPFPAAELFSVLPWYREILRGLLGADLIGLHTQAYVRNFLDACSLLPGVRVDHAAGRVHDGDRSIEVGAFPVGIEVDEFGRIADEPGTVAQAESIRAQIGVKTLLLGVDRLDYTKGLQQRLAAIDRLLTRRPALRRALSLIQIAVPSRIEVPEYRAFKKALDESAGAINGKYAEDGWQPIHLVYRTFGRRKLIAHYLAADIALVTPLRDGMNLVAKEFCAARTDCGGVLILSEFAGSAESLGDGALMVNPFDIERFADTIGLALELPPDARAKRMRVLRAAIERYDVHDWVADFLQHADAVQRPGRDEETAERAAGGHVDRVRRRSL
jgi:alpha,alpha-trehalose-phosphate synthase [UDP-forming]